MDHFAKPEIPPKAQKYYDKVKDVIKYCMYDQPYDGGDVIWLLGEKTDLIDVFNDYNIPEKYHDVIAANMVCQGCGHDDFELYSDVCTESRIDLEIQAKIADADKKYKKKIDELLNFITAYPSLVVNNPLAKRIHKEIMGNTLPVYKIDSARFFRGRLVRGSDVFTSEHLGAPTIGIANVGRYNHAGQSVLYLSESEEGSITEVLGDDSIKALIWMQEYVVTDVTNILDLTMDWDKYYSLDSILFTALLNNAVLERKTTSGSTWKPEYLLTNFVADTAKLAGYSGIRYNSSVGWHPNIVLFDPKQSDVTPNGNPRVIIYEPKRDDDLFDF
ncbi:RES family NAD+ phosphorylase [Mucilaginibacter litoreus]|uniref:RES family NAD+ phosphorylase n=1 Tax=Mucilaginibacter litoreus TaxID=1048221 RepID=A0ABW3AMW3_9SPHI